MTHHEKPASHVLRCWRLGPQCVSVGVEGLRLVPSTQQVLDQTAETWCVSSLAPGFRRNSW